MKFSNKDFSIKFEQIQSFLQYCGVFTFTEEILNGKLHFCVVLDIMLNSYPSKFKLRLTRCIYKTSAIYGMQLPRQGIC